MCQATKIKIHAYFQYSVSEFHRNRLKFVNFAKSSHYLRNQPKSTYASPGDFFFYLDENQYQGHLQIKDRQNRSYNAI